MKIGTSDHSSIKLKFTAVDSVPNSKGSRASAGITLGPGTMESYEGCIQKRNNRLGPSYLSFSSVDAAVASLDGILEKIIVKYVKKTIPRSTPSHPWWNRQCEKAFKAKQRAWEGPTLERYHAAVKRCRLTQRRAFATYNRKLKSRLAKLRCNDREFWTLTKEIGGIARSNASAAPSAEALAEHFADKMSNAKGMQESEYMPADPLRAPLSS